MNVTFVVQQPHVWCITILIFETISYHLECCLIMYHHDTIFCSHCGKRFANETSVWNHQKQLSSKYWKTYSLLLDLQQPSIKTNLNVNVQPSTLPPSLPSLPFKSNPPLLNADMESPPLTPSLLPEVDMEINQPPQQEAILPSFHTESFLGSSKVFGNRETYRDVFNKNKYVDAWQTSLYYPFVS